MFSVKFNSGSIANKYNVRVAAKTTQRATKCKAMILDSTAETVAQAVKIAADQEGCAEAVYNDFSTVGPMFESQKAIQAFSSPIVSEDYFKQAITALAEKTNLNDLTQKTILLLAKERRGDLIAQVAEAYKQRHQQAEGIKVVTVVSAQKLEQEQLVKIASKIQSLTGSKNIKINPEIDEGIKGGIIIKYDAYQLDLSYKGATERFIEGVKKEIDQEYGEFTPTYQPLSFYDPKYMVMTPEEIIKQQMNTVQEWRASPDAQADEVDLKAEMSSPIVTDEMKGNVFLKWLQKPEQEPQTRADQIDVLVENAAKEGKTIKKEDKSLYDT